MSSNKKIDFCQQFSFWLHGSEWHFTTLLAASIESVHNLPDDVDQLINELLMSFRAKPSASELLNFLDKNDVIDNWFQFYSNKPSITSFNLDLKQPLKPLKYLLPDLTSTIDLAEWFDITLGELEWLADLKRRDQSTDSKLKHYHYSLLAKRRGGVRLIESPKSLLKEIQRKINSDLLSKVPVHDAAYGFCTDRNTMGHAQNHSGKKNVLLFDIANYFHCIQWPTIFRTFHRLGYSKEVTKYLTGICSHQLSVNDSIVTKLDNSQAKLLLQRHLPQGAPTSPTLSNIIMMRLDKRLTGLSDSLQMIYSRYADDLAFSSNQNRSWRFMESLVGSICLEEGFELNHRKSRIIKSHQRQKLTGIIVNQFPNVDRRYYDELKATLHNCVRDGLESQNKQNHPYFYEHLLGAVNHVSSLNENRGARLRKTFDKIIVENKS